ncbi:MAG: hypothetical protein ACT4NY_04895 [Pseudonocardiales bacterium]
MAPQTGDRVEGKRNQGGKRNRKNRKNAYRDVNTVKTSKIWTWIGSVVLAVLAVILAFTLAPSQQVGVERAIEKDKDLQDLETAPARVTSEPIYTRGYESLTFTDDLAPSELALLKQEITHPVVTAKAHRILSATYGQTDPRSRQDIEFTLTGQHFAPVSVREITVRAVGRREPVNGTMVWVHPEGGSETGQIGFELDSPDARARTLDTEGNPTRHRYFEKNQVTLARDEQFTFSVSVITVKYDYDFVFDIRFSDDWVLTVDDGGKPWTISALASSYQNSYRADAINGIEITSCAWPTGCRAPRFS